MRYDSVEELRDQVDMAANVGQVCVCVCVCMNGCLSVCLCVPLNATPQMGVVAAMYQCIDAFAWEGLSKNTLSDIRLKPHMIHASDGTAPKDLFRICSCNSVNVSKCSSRQVLRPRLFRVSASVNLHTCQIFNKCRAQNISRVCSCNSAHMSFV
jgi:hypothetical protein